MTMHIAAAALTLDIPENHSLKGKRAALQPLLRRLRQRYNVSVAEVGDLDRWSSSVIGVCAVGNDAAYVNSVISKAVAFVEQWNGEAALADYSLELITL